MPTLSALGLFDLRFTLDTSKRSRRSFGTNACRSGLYCSFFGLLGRMLRLHQVIDGPTDSARCKARRSRHCCRTWLTSDAMMSAVSVGPSLRFLYVYRTARCAVASRQPFVGRCNRRRPRGGAACLISARKSCTLAEEEEIQI